MKQLRVYSQVLTPEVLFSVSYRSIKRTGFILPPLHTKTETSASPSIGYSCDFKQALQLNILPS